ncbi:PTS sugar transporter subunit IIA [Streptococcus tangpeifui]|uniref:PTS sugar transporter subunit IIA n=1 Tax=Streptococcus tangpeifui TaxID=2709400 RepID=UPI0013E9A342|nr:MULTISPECIES: PTS sugar transporter subunit IIA [unclassified Streptococcus]
MFERHLVNFSQETYQNKYQVIESTGYLPNKHIDNADIYIQDVKEREDAVPTYIGFGIAIPHAVSEGVKEPFVIYRKLKEPLIWSEDSEEVSHIFMIGVPKDKGSKQHLKIISELSKSLMREDYRNQLLHAENEDSVYRLLQQIEERLS